MSGGGRMQRREAWAGSEKERLYILLKSIIDFLSICRVFWTCLVFLVVSAILDFFSCIKVCYNEGNLIAVIVLIWTFTVSFSAYCIEHAGESYYGIRRADILLFDLGLKGLITLVSLIFLEIIALISAIIFKWKFMIITIALEQIFITIYIPMVVIMKTSYTNTLMQIEKEMSDAVRYNLKGLCRNIKGDRQSDYDVYSRWPRLFQMIRELDYSKDKSTGLLLDIIKRILELLKEELYRSMEYGIPRGNLETKRAVNVVSYQMVSEMLKAVQMEAVRVDFLSQLMVYGRCIEFSQGVMMALMENAELANVSVCQELLLTEKDYQRELHVFCAVYNVFMQTNAGEEWRLQVYTKRLFEQLQADWRNDDTKMALAIWEQIQDDNDMHYESLFQYIFSF